MNSRGRGKQKIKHPRENFAWTGPVPSAPLALNKKADTCFGPG